MKHFKAILSLIISLSFISNITFGQANASLNILTLNNGQVEVGAVVDVQVSVGNTGPASIGQNKVRAQLSIPTAIATAVMPNDQQTGLPPGWIITANSGGSITVCNGTDIILADEQRQVFIKVRGTAIGGPSTINGSLSFGPGTAVCTGPGSLSGDNIGDNTSTTSIQVTVSMPLTLVDFKAELISCKARLIWTTTNEINTDRFEIEKNIGDGIWMSAGTVQASGNSNAAKTYSFLDNSANSSSKTSFYRLKMIDSDGTFSYSEILRVSSNCNSVKAEVYPNPVQNGRLYISLTGITGYADVILLNLTGQVISKSRFRNGTSYIETSGILNGVYHLRIKDANGTEQTIKVLIQQ